MLAATYANLVHQLAARLPAHGRRPERIEAAKRLIAESLAAYPDLRLTHLDVLADRVVASVVIRGSDNVSYWAFPLGR